MARTTAAAVKELMLPGRDYDTVNNPSLDPYIASATVIIDRVVECATGRDVTLTDEELELMERWLAAHAYCASDQPYSTRSTQGASGTFQGTTALYLEGTKYGMMAMSIDYSGCLASLTRGHFLRMAWLGKPPSVQIKYRDRD